MNRAAGKFGWALFFLLVVYFIFLIRQDIIDYLSLKKERDAASQNFSRGNEKIAGLKNRLARIKGDDLVEEIARTRLGLIKKGEIAYKVISR